MLRIRQTNVRQQGFNLMELMVVLFVASLLMSIGVPAFNDFMDNSRMSSATNDVTTSLHLARTEAVKRRAVVAICPSKNWNSDAPSCAPNNGLENGWIVFLDAVPPAAPNMAPENADAVLYAHGPLADGISFTAASRTAVIGGAVFLMFQPNGFPAQNFFFLPTAFNLQLCDKRGDKTTGGDIAAGRWIQIAPTGRPQIHRARAEIESSANPAGGCS